MKSERWPLGPAPSGLPLCHPS